MHHYHKTSLLELDVILSNNKQRLFKAYYLLQFFVNVNNSNFKHKPIKSSYDLWNGKKSLSTEQLMSIIEINAVWKELQDIWDFPLKEINCEFLLANASDAIFYSNIYI